MMNRQRLCQRVAFLAAALVIVSMITSCAWRDWSRKLPGGYEIGSVWSDYVVISRASPPNEIVIESNVRRYKVLPSAIIGYADKAPARIGDTKAGFFLIELKGGSQVYQGLTRKQWLARLRECGIRREPKLDEI